MLWILLVACASSPKVTAQAVSPEAAAVAKPSEASSAQPTKFTITSKDEVWTRTWKQKPTGAEIPVSLPVITLPDPAAQAKADKALSVKALLDQTRAEIEEDGWVDRITWKETFRGGGLVNLDIHVEGSGAYPDSWTKHVVMSMETGARVGADTFAKKTSAALISRLNDALQAKVQAKVAEDPEVAELLSNVAFAKGGLDHFSVSRAGVVFHHTFALPHALAAAAPGGDLLLPWAETGHYLSRSSPLARLASGQ